MSASELHRRAAKALGEKRDEALTVTANIRYSAPMVSEQTGAVVASPTCENIAMRAIEANALARAYDQAAAILSEIYREMTAPDKGTDKTAPTQREAPYQ